MSARNPHFHHADGAAWELPTLIKNLGDVSYGEALTEDRLHIVDAIQTHARNVQELLHDGIRSVGHLMELTGCGDLEVSNEHITQLGSFLKHLAGEADFMRATESDMHQILKAHAAQQVKAKPVGRRGASGVSKDRAAP
jgi:hypothetical protein